MKFGKSIGSQQDSNVDLHYVDYKILKKRIKDVVSCQQARELADALTANTAFEEELVREIGQVNSCFAERQQELLSRTGLLAEELQHQSGGCGSASQGSGGGSGFGGSGGEALEPSTARGSRDPLALASRQHPEAFRSLVSILREVDQLRKYAVWNAVAVVKILKKRRKQTNFGLEDTAAERAGWLSRQSFFSGSDFAELHAAIESLGHMLVLSELAPERAAAAAQPRERDLQQCPICLDTICDMVELSCNHRFCWKCYVLGPIAHQPGEYRITQCPICRKETTRSEQEATGRHEDGTDGVMVPSSEGFLTRFLHTYFPQEDAQQAALAGEGEGDEEQQARCEGEQIEREMSDVVSELVKALLADSTWQQPPKSAQQAFPLQSGQQEAASSSACVPSDFFQTLPQKSQQDRQLIGAAQKLQWLQLASTGDPFALDGTTYCALCSEPLLMEAVVTTPCKHHFHRVCISRVDMPQCPLCSCDLPFAWFLPEQHPCAEQGFRVVSPYQYKPQFPGGPSKGTAGYPLRRPPPMSLYGKGGLVMKSYLHRIPPTADTETEETPSSASAPPPPERRPVETPDGDSTASESSSEESGSEDGGDALSPKQRRGERKWAYGALGKMRLASAPAWPMPAGSAASSGAANSAAAAAAASEPADEDVAAGGSCVDSGQRSRTLLLIGDHL